MTENKNPQHREDAKRSLKIPTLSLYITDADNDDLELVREFVRKYAGVEGLANESIVYHAFLRFVEVVMLAERRGSEDDKRALASEFLVPEVSEVEDEEESNTITNTEEELRIIEENRRRLGLKGVTWTPA